MLAISPNARLFQCLKPIDLRKGFEGLSSSIQENFSDLMTGAYFIFINKRRDRMKVLYWDSDGLAIWYKRLEKGSFPKQKANKCSLDRREFFMLLEGITPKRLQPRFRLS